MVSGDLAFTVTIEHCDALVEGQSRSFGMPLRITNIFRKEKGRGKLLHYHADPVVAKTAAAAILHP
jgi:ketosteroid isomerase-like protein